MKKERSDEMYELPFLPGQRVCLNPEMKDYQDMSKYLGCNVGYVIKFDISLNNLKLWSTFKNKQDKRINVQFDDGSIYNLQLKDLLLVDAPPLTVHHYTLSTGYDFLYVEGDKNAPNIIKRLDNEIINNGRKVIKYEKYDNEWRAKVIQDILNYDSNNNTEKCTTNNNALADALREFTEEVSVNNDDIF